jgi:hypothetical protein
MNQEMKNKREELKALSAGFKMLIKEGAIDSVNQGLANYYAEQGHTVLKSYKRWTEEGYQVKRGSKALLMWGEPRAYGKQEDKATKEGNEKEETFFPLAYVFSNLQVEQSETATQRR